MTFRYPADAVEQAKAVLEAWKEIDPALQIGGMAPAALEANLTQVNALYAELNKLDAQGKTVRVRRFITMGSPLVPTRFFVWLFKNIEDLKEKLISVVVVVLAVFFLGKVIEAKDPRTVLELGAGIALVIAALGYFVSRVLLHHDE